MKYIAIVLLCIAFVSPSLADSWVNTDYNTTEGNEFYVTTMKHAGANAGSGDALKVYLYATARQATNICVTNNYSYREIISIPEGGQGGLNIPLEYIYADCTDENIDVSNSVKNIYEITNPQDKSLYIYTCDAVGNFITDKKISLYITSFHKNFGYEATNILPIRALENAYMIQTYHTDNDGTEFAVVATKTNQSFSLNTVVTERDDNFDVSGMDTSFLRTVVMDKGQVFVVKSAIGDYSLSGTTICSDAKFFVVNGNQYTKIPKATERLNHIFEQSLSADKWGRDYVVTPTSGHIVDYVLLTALENNTQIKKDNSHLVTLQKGETYTDVITQDDGDVVPYYSSNNNFMCYLYETSSEIDEHIDNKIKWGRPTMTSITPMNLGLHSIIVAAFNASAKDIGFSTTEFPNIKEHYVNIVTEKDYKESIYIDDTIKISDFKPVPGNPKFYYCLYKIDGSKSHLLKSNNPKGTFVVRMYGHSDKHSYAYNGGFRINRKIDILINDEYKESHTFCKEEEVKLTSIIGFEYESLTWQIESDNFETVEIPNDSVLSYLFATDTTKNTNYDVKLIVTSKMPDICNGCTSCGDMLLADTVSVQITAKYSNNDYTTKNVCLGDSFVIYYDGGKDSITYIADTQITQQKPNSTETFKLRVNTVTRFIDTLVNENGCNTIHYQQVIVREPETNTLETAICDNLLPYVWKYNGGKDSLIINTIRGEELTLTREIEYNNIYTCDCLAKLILHIYPSKIDTTWVDTCQQPIGSVYQWANHDGHMVYDVQKQKKINADSIPIDQPGEYTYIDSLKTQCNECPKCDSIIALKLTVYPMYSFIQDTTLSNEDYIEWQGLTLGGEDAPISKDSLDYVVTKDTTLFEAYTTRYDCDSTYTLRIHYGKLFRDTTDATICENESEYIWYWNGRALDTIAPLPTQDTTYVHTTKSSIGVDSIFYLNLSINPISMYSYSVAWCRSAGPYESKYPNLKGLTSSGVYRDTLRGANPHGCDSIIELYLTILDGFKVDTTINMCDNEYVVWQDRIYKGSNYMGSISNDTLPIILLSDTVGYKDSISYASVLGCDSMHSLTLNVYASYEMVKDTTIRYICDNESYPFIDTIYNANGEWVDAAKTVQRHVLTATVASQNGCDSAIAHVVYVFPTYIETAIDTTCQSLGDMYNWSGHNRPLYSQEQGKYVDEISLDIPGSYTFIDSLKAKRCDECIECDSVHILKLTVLPSYIILDKTVKFSEEETYTWDKNGVTYGGKNTTSPHAVTVYKDTTIQYGLRTELVGTHACDSILLLDIQIGKVYRDTLKDSICGNLPYIWLGIDENGKEIERMVIDTPRTKVYQVDFITSMGFDSIFYLDLTVYPAYVKQDSMTTYERTCQNSLYTWSRHNEVLKSDSLYCVTNKRWIDANEIPTDIVGTFTYIDSMTTIHGCDSIYTLILQIDEEFVSRDTIHICNDTFAIWHDTIYVGTEYIGTFPDPTMEIIKLAPQTYRDTVIYKTETGCDSTVYLYLNIHEQYDVIDYQVACDDSIPYIWITKDSFGEYYDTIAYEPAVEYLDPITNKPTKDIIQLNSTRTLTSIHGCDSVVNLDLTIYPTYRFVTSASICSNKPYEWRGNKYEYTGRYYDDTTTVYGCDSIYVLDLYVKPVVERLKIVNICDDETLVHADTIYDGQDTIIFTTVLWEPGDIKPTPDEYDLVRFESKDGECDSIIYKYSIHVNPTFRTDTFVTLCSNEVLLLNEFSISLDTMYSVDYSISAIDTILMDTLQTIHGCDSVLVCHAHILPAYKYIDYDTICESDTCFWRDTMFVDMLPGDHSLVDNMTSIYGCDSIYELRLHVNPIYEFEYDTTICSNELFIFYGDTLTETGTYHANHPSIYACDSVTTLHLTVHDTTFNLLYDTICISEKYRFRDSIITQTGHYAFVSTNEWGCMQYDSICLTVIDTTTYTLYIGDILCADEEELMVEYEVVSGPELIEYSVLFDQFGHSQGFDDIYHAPLDTKGRYLSIPLPKGEVLPHPTPTYFDSQQGVNQYTYDDKHAYPLPANYHITVIMHNAICGDTLQRKDTTFNLLYPSWIHEQHWNDGIVLYNDMYNGGHKFSAYQWYQNGDTIYGATKEYLHIPSDLLMNDRGNCENYYQVELTRESDGYKTMTCPICPVLLGDTIVPTKDYFSIVPTIVDHRNPIVHILSTKPGKYSYVPYNLLGQGVGEHKQGTFVPNGNNYAGIIDLSGLGTGTILINVIVDDQPRAFYITIN